MTLEPWRLFIRRQSRATLRDIAEAAIDRLKELGEIDFEPEDRDDDESEDRLYWTESGEEVGSA